MSNYYYWASTL